MENDQLFKKALPALQNIYLTPEEKSTIRLRLIEHMRAHPHLSFFERLQSISMSKPVAALMVMLLVGISSGGVATFAAEGSLPGDVLYPLKTGISEPVVGFIKSFSLPTQVAFEWKLVEKRLVEAEQLAEDVLTTQKEAIRTSIARQRTKAEDLARKLIERENSSVNIVSTMDTTLSNAVAVPAKTERSVKTEQAARANQKTDITVKAFAPKATTPKATVEPSAVPSNTGISNITLQSEVMPLMATSTDGAAADVGEVSTPVTLQVEQAQVSKTGTRVFEEIDRIFGKHKGIIEKLDIPLPYVEVTKPPEPEAPLPLQNF